MRLTVSFRTASKVFVLVTVVRSNQHIAACRVQIANRSARSSQAPCSCAWRLSDQYSQQNCNAAASTGDLNAGKYIYAIQEHARNLNEPLAPHPLTLLFSYLLARRHLRWTILPSTWCKFQSWGYSTRVLLCISNAVGSPSFLIKVYVYDGNRQFQMSAPTVFLASTKKTKEKQKIIEKRKKRKRRTKVPCGGGGMCLHRTWTVSRSIRISYLGDVLSTRLFDS